MSGESRVKVEALESFCVAVMRKAGMTAADARAVAEVLVTTDTWGVSTHGTKQLRPLLKNFRDGKMSLSAKTELVAEGPSWASYDGNRTMPIISSRIAMGKAIEKAKATGIAVATVRNSGHFGAAGFYSNLAAQADCIGISMCNVDAGVAVPGSRGPVLGTNPISYAAPAGGGRSVLLDIATSVTAASKIFQAKATGTTLPPGLLIDGDGRPTTDPSNYPAVGALLPMAGHKGYGIALMVELLTGVLAGGAFGRQIVSWLAGPTPVNQSLSFIAISVAMFMTPDEFRRRVDRLAAEIRASPKAVGADRIYLPGEKEWEARERALADGIPLPPDVVANLRGLAEDYSLDVAGLLGIGAGT